MCNGCFESFIKRNFLPVNAGILARSAPLQAFSTRHNFIIMRGVFNLYTTSLKLFLQRCTV